MEEKFHRDAENRPIREGRTPHELLRDGEISYEKCPYAGSRHQHDKPMNVSALRQISAHWDEIIDALAQLRDGYAKARIGYGPDLRDIWYVSQLGCALPWFYILRDGMPPPPWASSLAKATLGTGILAHSLVAKLLTERWIPPPLTAATLADLADRSGTLVGPFEVCSAPKRMIVQFCEVLASKDPMNPKDICRLRDRLDEVIVFGETYAGFKILLWLFYLARRFLYADGNLDELFSEPPEPPDLFVVEPRDHRSISGVQRRLWLRQLSGFLLPLSGRVTLLNHGNAIADAMIAGGSLKDRWRILEQAFTAAASACETFLSGREAKLDGETVRRLFSSAGARLINHQS